MLGLDGLDIVCLPELKTDDPKFPARPYLQRHRNRLAIGALSALRPRWKPISVHSVLVFVRLPRHIGIIPDGNRRWADSSNVPRRSGYAAGRTAGNAFVATVPGVRN